MHLLLPRCIFRNYGPQYVTSSSQAHVLAVEPQIYTNSSHFRDSPSSEEPHINKNQPHSKEEANPDLPPHARLLSHPQHTIHGPS